MPLSGEEIRHRLFDFAAKWSVYDGSEREEAQTVLNELFACYGQDRQVAGACGRGGFSERYLTRVFHRELHTTPARYVEAVRIEAAHGLQEQTDITLKVIAERSGLGSAEIVRRVFVREPGVPPQSYRRCFAAVGP